MREIANEDDVEKYAQECNWRRVGPKDPEHSFIVITPSGVILEFVFHDDGNLFQVGKLSETKQLSTEIR
jgi:hypothetical protein